MVALVTNWRRWTEIAEVERHVRLDLSSETHCCREPENKRRRVVKIGRTS